MKKIIYIAHPISWDIKWNIQKVLDICQKIHKDNNDIIPIAPYIVSLQYLDDNIIEDRLLGIESNTEHFSRWMIDEVWLFWDKISNWMKYEIDLAKKHNIPIFIKNQNLFQDEFLKENNICIWKNEIKILKKIKHTLR